MIFSQRIGVMHCGDTGYISGVITVNGG